jgi:hypothetical protein
MEFALIQHKPELTKATLEINANTSRYSPAIKWILMIV